MSKKILTFLCVLALVFTLSGCGENKKTGDTPQDGSATETATSDPENKEVRKPTNTSPEKQSSKLVPTGFPLEKLLN